MSSRMTWKFNRSLCDYWFVKGTLMELEIVTKKLQRFMTGPILEKNHMFAIMLRNPLAWIVHNNPPFWIFVTNLNKVLEEKEKNQML